MTEGDACRYGVWCTPAGPAKATGVPEYLVLQGAIS